MTAKPPELTHDCELSLFVACYNEEQGIIPTLDTVVAAATERAPCLSSAACAAGHPITTVVYPPFLGPRVGEAVGFPALTRHPGN